MWIVVVLPAEGLRCLQPRLLLPPSNMQLCDAQIIQKDSIQMRYLYCWWGCQCYFRWLQRNNVKYCEIVNIICCYLGVGLTPDEFCTKFKLTLGFAFYKYVLVYLYIFVCKVNFHIQFVKIWQNINNTNICVEIVLKKTFAALYFYLLCRTFLHSLLLVFIFFKF